jgi:toxin ParE1/3/4
MTKRYVLAPEAAPDLVQIWRYLKEQSSIEIATALIGIRDKIVFLATNSGAGHWRKDLTDEVVKFFPVYSYLIVYRPETKPCKSSLFFTDAATSNNSSEVVYETCGMKVAPQEKQDIGAGGLRRPPLQMQRQERKKGTDVPFDYAQGKCPPP